MPRVKFEYKIPPSGLCLPAISGSILGKMSPYDWKSHNDFTKTEIVEERECGPRLVDFDIRFTYQDHWEVTGNTRLGDGKILVTLDIPSDMPRDYFERRLREAFRKRAQEVRKGAREREAVHSS